MTGLLTFTVSFHSPFRVGTSTAVPGAHQSAWHETTADEQLVAPASTVKGVMRAAAAELMPPPLVAAVFGAPGEQSPWSWSALTVPRSAVTQRLRTRIEIKPETGTVAEDMLAVAEELVIDAHGTFTIRRLGFVKLGAEQQARHEAVLTVAAGLVKGIGGTRRRGLGWVSICPAGDDPTVRYSDAVAALPELTGGPE